MPKRSLLRITLKNNAVKFSIKSTQLLYKFKKKKGPTTTISVYGNDLFCFVQDVWSWYFKEILRKCVFSNNLEGNTNDTLHELYSVVLVMMKTVISRLHVKSLSSFMQCEGEGKINTLKLTC